MKDELRLAFQSKRFYVAASIMFVCFLGFTIPNWIMSADWGKIYRPSALELSLGSIFFGGVMLLMPFCAAFPHATSQVDELRTSYLQAKVMRKGINRYALHKALATMISGGVAVALPFFLNMFIWHFIALPYDPATYPNQKIVFYQTVIWRNWDEIFYAFPIYLWIGISIFICSAIWGFFGLTASVWFPDKVLCTVIPVCIYHLWMSGFTDYVFGIKLVSPEALFNDGLSADWVWQSIVCYGILLLVSAGLYRLGLERRSRDD